MACAADHRGAVRARGAALALLLALTLPAAFPHAQAQAAQRARICNVVRTPVLNSPDGFVVGYLFRPDPVVLVRRTADRRWARIPTSDELRGWVRARYLCRR